MPDRTDRPAGTPRFTGRFKRAAERIRTADPFITRVGATSSGVTSGHNESPYATQNAPASDPNGPPERPQDAPTRRCPVCGDPTGVRCCEFGAARGSSEASRPARPLEPVVDFDSIRRLAVAAARCIELVPLDALEHAIAAGGGWRPLSRPGTTLREAIELERDLELMRGIRDLRLLIERLGTGS